MKLNGDEVDVFADIKALTLAAAGRFTLLATKAVEEHGVFAAALSGGSTPRALYRLMAADQVIRSTRPIELP